MFISIRLTRLLRTALIVQCYKYNLIFNRLFFPEKNNKKKKLPYDLSLIYTKSCYRVAFKHKIQKGLANLEGSRCCVSYGMNYLRKYIRLGNLIGKGDWGNVYQAWLVKDKNKKRKFWQLLNNK